MPYPSIVSSSTTGRSSSTSYAASVPSVSGAGPTGCAIAIVSTRVNAVISAPSGWFKVGEIRRTSGAIGTTAIFGIWTDGTQPSNPTFTTTSSTTWYVTWLIIDNADSLGSSTQFTLGTASSSTTQTTGSISLDGSQALTIGVFTDSRTSSLSAQSSQTIAVDSFNATYDLWHFVVYDQITSTGSTTFNATPSATASMREAAFYIRGTTNTAPAFTIQPTFATGRTYDIGTATTLPYIGSGSSNGGTISFRGTDSQQTGANALTYNIRTSATPGSGSLVKSGYTTSGVTTNVSIDNGDSGLTSSGAKTLYVHLSDGTYTTVSNPINLTVDGVGPPTSYTVTVEPSPVYDYTVYRIRFTPTDAVSTESNQLRYDVRTGADGTGTLLTSGTATSGIEVVTDYIADYELTTEAPTRYLRIQDAGGNISTKVFNVTTGYSREWDYIAPVSQSLDDGYFSLTSSSISTSGSVAIAGWTNTTTNQAIYLRFPSHATASPAYTTNYAAIYGRFQMGVTNYVSPPVQIYGVKQLNPSSPTTAAEGRDLPLTDAVVHMSPQSYVNGQPFVTPDLSPIIDEIKSQPGWTAGNAIMFILKTDSSYAANTQLRLQTFEAGAYPILFMDWNPVAIIDEQMTSASLIEARVFSSIEGRTVNAVEGEPVRVEVVTTGTLDGRVMVETGPLDSLPVWTTGQDILVQDDQMETALVTAVDLSGTDSLEQSETAGMVPLSVVTTGVDVGHYHEVEGTVEAILEALSEIEDFDMVELGVVESITVHTSGFDLVSGMLDDSNPITLYVETMGTDFFEMGPQVYDEVDGEIVVIEPVSAGVDTSTMYSLGPVDLYHADTNSTVEFYQGRYEEFNDPVVLQVIDHGTDTMVMNASLDEVYESGVVTTSSVLEHHQVEPAGWVGIVPITEGLVETYQHGEMDGRTIISALTTGQETSILTEMEGAVVPAIVSEGTEGMVLQEFEGSVMIRITTTGYEGNLLEEFAEPVLIAVVSTSSEEEHLIRGPQRYYRSALVVEHPYAASTLEVLRPYARSSLITLHQMRESVLAAT